MNKLRIIFMGTPDFAVASLKALVEAGENIVAVLTAPDRKSGRGQKLSQSPVKDYALSQDIPVLQPTNLKSKKFNKVLKSYEVDLQIVVAFRMLPEMVWSMPRLGTFNLHASLLPQYRGAAPINWAIINGDSETGVTTFFIEKEIDTGKIIYQESIAIADSDSAGSLHDKLMLLGAKLILKTVKAITEGDFPQTEQDDSLAENPAPKIYKETCEINWNQGIDQVDYFIRGMSPYPAAWTVLEDKQLKIYEVEKVCIDHEFQAGDVISDGKKKLGMAAQDGYIWFKSIQLQGKKRMDIPSFLNGYKVEANIALDV